MSRYDFLNVTGSESLNTLKKKGVMNSFIYKYKGGNIGYINNHFSTFSDLELSFWLELRYLKAVFCKM